VKKKRKNARVTNRPVFLFSVLKEHHCSLSTILSSVTSTCRTRRVHVRRVGKRTRSVTVAGRVQIVWQTSASVSNKNERNRVPCAAS